MASKPEKKSYDKRETIQLDQRYLCQSQPDYENDKENNLYSISKVNKSIPKLPDKQKIQQNVLQLLKDGTNEIEQFSLFNDCDIGISKQFSIRLQQCYEVDDDVQTTLSVQEQFVELCMRDLENAFVVEQKRVVKMRSTKEQID